VSGDLGSWGGAEFVLAADRLDTPDVIETADPGDMLRQVASSAAQVRTALRSCQETDLSAFAPDIRPRAIVVAGMGSSGLPGEILNAITGLGSPVQIVVTQADRLPGWVGAADAVIAVSCSGTTPETLAIATEAARRGCRLAGVGAQGSPLHRIAEQARAPFVPVVPAGWPRSMLWGVSIPLLVIAEQLGIVRIGADVYELPMVWGTSVLSGVAARRFASQLNENAKYPAISGVLSGAAHNQVAAFDGPFAPRSSPLPAPGPDEPILPPVSEGADLEDLDAWDLDYEDSDDSEPSGFTALRLVLIVDPDQDQRAAAQRAAVTDLVTQRGVGMSELAMDGEHPLVRLAGVIQLVDYASVYLAIASGIDPGQAVAIDDLQSRIE